MRKLTHEEIVQRQTGRLQEPRLPFCVVLNDIRSLYNVGAIFRTADGAGVEKIWLCGITGYPPQGGIAKTALGAQDHVLWEYREDVLGLIKELKKKKFGNSVYDRAIDGVVAFHLAKNHMEFDTKDFDNLIEKIKSILYTQHSASGNPRSISLGD